MFSTEVLLALAVAGLLAIAIPVTAVIVFKRKNPDSWLPSAFIGAATFIVFAMILESILHSVMLPIVQNSVIWYSVYGALAAGVFEETGRFVAYKTLMRNRLSTKNAVLMGLGHGGFEAIYALGVTLLTYLALAIMANSVGIDEVIRLTTNGDAATAEVARAQLAAIQDYNFVSCALGVYERVIAMIFHVCMSVFVYKAVSQKGKIWLYPTAIALHALLDFPVALYQKGVVSSILVLYVILTLFTVLIAAVTVIMARKMRD